MTFHGLEQAEQRRRAGERLAEKGPTAVAAMADRPDAYAVGVRQELVVVAVASAAVADAEDRCPVGQRLPQAVDHA